MKIVFMYCNNKGPSEGKGAKKSLYNKVELTNLTRTEKLVYEAEKELNSKGISLQKNKKAFNAAATLLGMIMYAEKVLAVPSTGVPKLDEAGWRLVGIMQSVVFWATMLYTFKSLLEWVIKGDDSAKRKVGTGFIIIALDYLIPWAFEIIRGIFV